MFKKGKKYKYVVFLVILAISHTVFASPKAGGNIIEGVPLISQMPNLPTGCEATAFTMLLNYYEVRVSKEDVARSMPKTSNPFMKNGKMYGEHPSNFFIGNPFSNQGYGVYAPVILKMMEKYLPERVEDLTGKNFSDLLKVIDEGRPVMVWTTIRMAPARLTRKWTTPTGPYQWTAPQHAMVMVGYDDQYVYLNDPTGGKRVKYARQIVENRWISLGRQALAVKDIVKNPYIDFSLCINDEECILEQDSEKIIGDDENIWMSVRALNKVIPELKISLVNDSVCLDKNYNITSIPLNTPKLKEGIPVTMKLDGRMYLTLDLIEELYQVQFHLEDNIIFAMNNAN